MKKTLFIALIIFCVLLTSRIIGQEIIKHTFEKFQQFDVMNGDTADIVQILPGEKIIEKTALDSKTVLFCMDKNGKRTKIYEGNRVGYFSHSQTGERICFIAGGEFVVKDLNANQEFRFQTVDPVYLSGFPNISPDGDEITFHKSARLSKKGETINDGIIMVRNLSTKEDRVIGNGGWPKWSPNSKQIVFSRVEGSRGNWTDYLWVVNSDGTGSRKLKNSAYLSGAHIEWSPDGKYVMDSDRKGNLRIVDFKKDEAVIVPPSRFGNIPNTRKEYIGASWSPDGKTILAEILITKKFTDEDMGRELYLISVDGTKIEKIEIPELNKQFPVWLNERELLFRDSKQGNIWNKAIIRSAE